jgi:hypothetical protein
MVGIKTELQTVTGMDEFPHPLKKSLSSAGRSRFTKAFHIKIVETRPWRELSSRQGPQFAEAMLEVEFGQAVGNDRASAEVALAETAQTASAKLERYQGGDVRFLSPLNNSAITTKGKRLIWSQRWRLVYAVA